MDSLSRTIVTGAVAAAVAAGATAWIMSTSNGKSDTPVLAGLTALPPEGAAARVPLGDLAGSVEASLPANLHNPLEGDSAALSEGDRLYKQMNCAGCHGYTAKGGMGPDLTDPHWRYGGTPVQIFKSIYEGRPKGMPAWGKALPAKSIWQLTTYIESLGGSFPAEAYHAALQGDLGNQGGEQSSKSPAHGSNNDEAETSR